MNYQEWYNSLKHMFCPLQGFLILAYDQHFTFKDKSAFDVNKKTRIGTKNHFGDGILNFT